MSRRSHLVVVSCSAVLGLFWCWALLARAGQRLALRNMFISGQASCEVTEARLSVPGKSILVCGNASLRAIGLAFRRARPCDPSGVSGSGVFRFRSGRRVRLSNLSIARCGRGFCLFAWTTYWFGGEVRPYRAKIAWPIPRRLAAGLSSLVAASAGTRSSAGWPRPRPKRLGASRWDTKYSARAAGRGPGG